MSADPRDRPAPPDFLVCLTEVTAASTGETGTFAYVPAVPEVGAWRVWGGNTYATIAWAARQRLAAWIDTEPAYVRAHVGDPLAPARPTEF